jgi:hypothetical protein
LKNGAVVAHQGAIPVRLKIDKEEVTTGWFVETMAAQAVRGSPIGPMLVKKALEEMPFNLSLGQTEQMRQLQFALGWRSVRRLSHQLLVCGYRVNLRNKLPPGVAEAAAVGLGLWYEARWAARRTPNSSQFRFSTIERFSHEHDELWARVARTCSCAVVRDSSYMNWKYIDRPGARFSCLELRDSAGLRGVIVSMRKDPNSLYRYARGFLVDIVAPLDETNSIRALVSQCVRNLKRDGAQSITCHVGNHAVESVLADLGFVSREPRYHFLISTGEQPDHVTRMVADPDNWLLSLGDSDTDLYVE